MHSWEPSLLIVQSLHLALCSRGCWQCSRQLLSVFYLSPNLRYRRPLPPFLIPSPLGLPAPLVLLPSFWVFDQQQNLFIVRICLSFAGPGKEIGSSPIRQDLPVKKGQFKGTHRTSHLVTFSRITPVCSEPLGWPAEPLGFQEQR